MEVSSIETEYGNEASHGGEFKLPKFYRILIIDDKIFQQIDYRDFMKVVFQVIVKSVDADYNCDVVIEGEPIKGFKRWCDEVFDLVLIDASFTLNRNQKEDDLANYLLSSDDQGVSLFAMIRSLLREGNPFFYRKSNIQDHLRC